MLEANRLAAGQRGGGGKGALESSRTLCGQPYANSARAAWPVNLIASARYRRGARAGGQAIRRPRSAALAQAAAPATVSTASARVEIVAEPPRGELLSEIAVGRRDDPDVD